jgi:hypothetical protein
MCLRGLRFSYGVFSRLDFNAVTTSVHWTKVGVSLRILGCIEAICEVYFFIVINLMSFRKILFVTTTLLVAPLVALTGKCRDKIAEAASLGNEKPVKQGIDALRIIYSIAEEKGMKVIADLNAEGGDLYSKHTPEQVAEQYRTYVPQFFSRYGKFKSFYGWYLNNELNPLKSDETTISTFWRTVWKSAVDECKNTAPGSVVTISPFFIMDKGKHRGFEFIEPIEYERWWSKTLRQTGIDILMLQDSGAEHLGFFTLEERRPFFQALRNACNQAGSKFWVNVETGEVDAKTWEEAVNMERTNTQKWMYTHTDWLAQKLKLAAEYGDNIVNWGYYPYMTPADGVGPYLTNDIAVEIRKQNYASYLDYVNKAKKSRRARKPLIKGALWWFPVSYDGWSEEQLEKFIRGQIEDQQKLGFDTLWIVNAPRNMEWAIGQEK